MAQAESRLSRSIISKLSELPGTFAWKNHGSEFMMAGLPDIIACRWGRFYGFEVKMPGKREDTSAAQKLVHEKIRAAGGKVYVVCSAAEAVTCILTNPEEPGAIDR